MLFSLDNLQIYQMSVSLQRVFHSIRFKVNKGWSTAVLGQRISPVGKLSFKRIA